MGGPGADGIDDRGSAAPRAWRERFGKYRRGEISDDEYRTSNANLNLDPAGVSPRSERGPLRRARSLRRRPRRGEHHRRSGVAEGPVEPCEPVPAPPSGRRPLRASAPGGGPGYTPIGDEALSQRRHRRRPAPGRRRRRSSGHPVEAPPEPGQFLYTKTKVVHLEGWLPEATGTGSEDHPRYFTATTNDSASARNALVPTMKEVWTAPDGKTHVRETLGRVNFFSAADQRRWEDAGSPPPWAFDPPNTTCSRDNSGRLVKDFASRVLPGPP